MTNNKQFFKTIQLQCGRRGNRYYSKWGDFLGIHGHENTIKVYTELDGLYPYGIPRRILNEKKIIEKSVFFNWVDGHTRLVIIRKIAETIGLFNVLTTYIPAKEVSDHQRNDSGYINHKTGKIMINPNSRFHINGDYYNILLTLYHEKYHFEHHYKRGYYKSQINEVEYETYKYIYNHHLFYESTYDYQGMVLDQMRECAKNLGRVPEI